jgi:UDP-N-acetylmuramyl pentapeptide synthase
MNWKWSYFIGAAVLATYAALACGAPLFAIAAGIALAATVAMRMRASKAAK